MVDKEVLTTRLVGDEAEALGGVEPLQTHTNPNQQVIASLHFTNGQSTAVSFTLQVPWVLAAILIVDGGDVWESDS